MNEDELYQWLHSEDEDQETVEKPELLTIKLFKKAILETEGNEGDRILSSFAENVLPNLLQQLVGATAKGGQFAEDRRAEGKDVKRSKEDQSFLAHLLNGLFPTYRIIKSLKKETPETNPVKRNCGEAEIILFIASYILHDFDKFSDYSSWLTANDPDNRFENRDWRKEPPKKDEAPNFGRDYVYQKVQECGLDTFLGESWESWINDIVWLSNNAGDKYDANLGLDIQGLKTNLDSRIRGTLANLVKLSDRFASVVKHPNNIEEGSLPEIIGNLSNHQFKFTYHSLSDNRGVLTNIINNALMDSHPKEFYSPLLYLPDGVVYLAKANAPAIKTDEIPNQVIAKIKSLCAERLKQKTIGFSRDGKGFKFADYYWLFFNTVELMQVSIDAGCKLIPSTKASSAKKRSDSLVAFQKAGELPSNLNVEFADDYRIDRLAEFGDTLCRGIWNQWREQFNNSQKELPKVKRQSLPELDLTQKLAEHLGLVDEITGLRAIQSLKKTGGVPLDWYYLAAKYIESKGLDDNQVRQTMAEMVDYCANLIQPILGEFTIADGWNDLHTYVSRIVSLDTESWVMPAWLALALALILDVKTVASESPVPSYISGADFEKTAILDGEHQAIRSLIKQDEYRLDSILPKNQTFSPLNALSAAYCIHLEVNRKKDGNPDWGKLSDLARDLETSPLYVFHYLTKLVRKLDWDTAPIPKIKLRAIAPV